ncbi:hypothetical protein HAZELMIKA_79 [Klebsiella phage vB_KaeD_HazelMika]|nr:hypothetical protein HAZELMIKA_79 [Klebsiella phage vB_KaeD_HazelMika]
MKQFAICTHSISRAFVVGEAYEIEPKKGGRGFHVGGNFTGYAYDSKTPDLIDVRGVNRTIASFNKGIARKKKSLLKMLVRAHVVYAKSRGWGDSKNGAHKSWSATWYKSANDWARCFALGYDIEAIELEAAEEGVKVDQEYLNWFVDEQMSYY